MWSPVYQAGADVMKRIGTPMIGGVIRSAILNFLIYPVIYVIWRKRSLPSEPPTGLAGLWNQGSAQDFTAVFLVGIGIAAVYFSWSSGIGNSIFKSADPKMPVAKVTQSRRCEGFHS
jgi:hypothetical protein